MTKGREGKCHWGPISIYKNTVKLDCECPWPEASVNTSISSNSLNRSRVTIFSVFLILLKSMPPSPPRHPSSTPRRPHVLIAHSCSYSHWLESRVRRSLLHVRKKAIVANSTQQRQCYLYIHRMSFNTLYPKGCCRNEHRRNKLPINYFHPEQSDNAYTFILSSVGYTAHLLILAQMWSMEKIQVP